MTTVKAPGGLLNLISKASWTVIDQGVVSLGNLMVNLQLAWLLPVEDYGVFALLLSGILGLQVLSSSLLFYPLSMRLATIEGEPHARLLTNTLILVLGACGLLTILLVFGLFFFGKPELIVPASALFICWQLQEATRRGLLADLRHREAAIGDSVTYIGEPLLLALFAAVGAFNLVPALYLMAAACLGGAVAHLTRLHLTKPALAETKSIFASFWLIGRWQLSMNAILFLNVRLYPWALAYAEGAAAAAGFQAMLNVINLMNPLIIGFGNAIPQIASKARAHEGLRRAWRASRAFILVGLPLAIVFSCVLFFAPGFVLLLFYGNDSPYLGIELAVQIVAISGTTRYVGDLICCFLIGAEAGRLAVMAYWTGLAVSLILLPFALPFGLAGIAATMTIASAVLLITSYCAVILTGATSARKAQKILPAT